MSQKPNFGIEQWIIDLSGIPEEEPRRTFLFSQQDRLSRSTVQALYDAVVIYARVDLQKADRMAQSATWIAAKLDDPYSSAQSARAVGHVLYLTGKYRLAIQEYE